MKRLLSVIVCVGFGFGAAAAKLVLDADFSKDTPGSPPAVAPAKLDQPATGPNAIDVPPETAVTVEDLPALGGRALMIDDRSKTKAARADFAVNPALDGSFTVAFRALAPSGGNIFVTLAGSGKAGRVLYLMFRPDGRIVLLANDDKGSRMLASKLAVGEVGEIVLAVDRANRKCRLGINGRNEEFPLPEDAAGSFALLRIATPGGAAAKFAFGNLRISAE